VQIVSKKKQKSNSDFIKEKKNTQTIIF